MGLFNLFKTGKRSPSPMSRNPVSRAQAAAPAPVRPRPALAKASHKHVLTETDSLPQERPIALNGPKGRFTVAVSGCGNEPEFKVFAYDDGKCSFYYYACPRATKDAKPGILVHHISQKRFSGPMTLKPKDEARARANLIWLFKSRDFHAPHLKIKSKVAPKQVDFIW